RRPVQGAASAEASRVEAVRDRVRAGSRVGRVRAESDRSADGRARGRGGQIRARQRTVGSDSRAPLPGGAGKIPGQILCDHLVVVRRRRKTVRRAVAVVGIAGLRRLADLVTGSRREAGGGSIASSKSSRG